LTLSPDDSKGLYVTNRSADSFQVHELGGGQAAVCFGYRIMALHKNYENSRFADHTSDHISQKALRGTGTMPGPPIHAPLGEARCLLDRLDKSPSEISGLASSKFSGRIPDAGKRVCFLLR
jgi:hypothetical protein